MALAATSALAGVATQYSSKAALLPHGTLATVTPAAAPRPAYVAASKPWLLSSSALPNIAAPNAASGIAAADQYNSKTALRGGGQSVQPAFEIAPLK